MQLAHEVVYPDKSVLIYTFFHLNTEISNEINCNRQICFIYIYIAQYKLASVL